MFSWKRERSSASSAGSVGSPSRIAFNGHDPINELTISTSTPLAKSCENLNSPALAPGGSMSGRYQRSPSFGNDRSPPAKAKVHTTVSHSENTDDIAVADHHHHDDAASTMLAVEPESTEPDPQTVSLLTSSGLSVEGSPPLLPRRSSRPSRSLVRRSSTGSVTDSSPSLSRSTSQAATQMLSVDSTSPSQLPLPLHSPTTTITTTTTTTTATPTINVEQPLQGISLQRITCNGSYTVVELDMTSGRTVRRMLSGWESNLPSDNVCVNSSDGTAGENGSIASSDSLHLPLPVFVPKTQLFGQSGSMKKLVPLHLLHPADLPPQGIADHGPGTSSSFNKEFGGNCMLFDGDHLNDLLYLGDFLHTMASQGTLCAVKDFWHRLRMFNRCAPGQSLCELLVVTSCAWSRTEALRVGQLLLDDGILIHVTGGDKQLFQDTSALYRFRIDEHRKRPAVKLREEDLDMASWLSLEPSGSNFDFQTVGVSTTHDPREQTTSTRISHRKQNSLQSEYEDENMEKSSARQIAREMARWSSAADISSSNLMDDDEEDKSNLKYAADMDLPRVENMQSTWTVDLYPNDSVHLKEWQECVHDSFPLEGIESELFAYRHHFYGRPHHVYFVGDRESNVSPVVLTVRILDDTDQLLAILREGHSRFSFQIPGQLLVRNPALRAPSDALLPLTKTTSLPAKLSLLPTEVLLRDVVSLIAPHMSGVLEEMVACDATAIADQILEFDEARISRTYKFAVVYCAPGQTTEAEMFGNTSHSPLFENFLELLGTRVVLKNFKGYLGGLPQTEGFEKSVYTRFAHREIMFHVSTLLPHSTVDRHQVERKKHIGNDIVCIVFKQDAIPFDPNAIRSQFIQVFLVVRAIVKPDGETYYTLTTLRRGGLPKFGPNPPQILLPHGLTFRRLLFTKSINAEHAAHRIEKFCELKRKRSCLLLKMLVRGIISAGLGKQRYVLRAPESNRASQLSPSSTTAIISQRTEPPKHDRVTKALSVEKRSSHPQTSLDLPETPADVPSISPAHGHRRSNSMKNSHKNRALASAPPIEDPLQSPPPQASLSRRSTLAQSGKTRSSGNMDIVDDCLIEVSELSSNSPEIQVASSQQRKHSAMTFAESTKLRSPKGLIKRRPITVVTESKSPDLNEPSSWESRFEALSAQLASTVMDLGVANERIAKLESLVLEQRGWIRELVAKLDENVNESTTV